MLVFDARHELGRDGEPLCLEWAGPPPEPAARALIGFVTCCQLAVAVFLFWAAWSALVADPHGRMASARWGSDPTVQMVALIGAGLCALIVLVVGGTWYVPFLLSVFGGTLLLVRVLGNGPYARR